MPPPSLLPVLSAICGWQMQPRHFTLMAGGSINEVYKVFHQGHPSFIVKLNSATKFPQLFAREASSLAALQPHITTPEVIGQGEAAGLQYLVLEWIVQDKPTPAFWKNFGAALAALHSVDGPSFGNFENNYMGSVPQDNGDAPTWTAFFAQRRLMPLAVKCADNGLLGKSETNQIEKLCNRLPQIFSTAAPTLLHGDLWSGNFLCGAGGVPVLIDPAVYYGHPSVDLGLTTLFGGFDAQFYEAYHYHKQLPPNYKDEWDLCNLYPLLIHLLLFGSGYLGAIRQTLQRFAGIQHRIV